MIALVKIDWRRVLGRWWHTEEGDGQASGRQLQERRK